MKRKNKISTIAFTIVFILLTAVTGIVSFVKLVKFYVNDEVDYNEWTADLGNKFETDIATSFFEKFEFVNLNGAMRNLLEQKEMNGVIKLNNGYLMTAVGYVDDETLQYYANKVALFDSYLINRGTKLVYALTPYISCKYDPQLPTGIEDYGNDNADRLMSMLETAGIDIIDFREAMHEDGINQYDMMYKTDHHWNTEAGFYAYGILEDYIINETGCNVDERISNINNYTITKYEEWHLGANGQRTGRYYAGIDDFDLIIPNFETSIQREDGTVGNMQDIAINMEPLEKKEYTSRYTYDLVLGASLGHFVNLNSENDIKVLIITDSFGKAVCPYLMMGFSEIYYIRDWDVSEITPDFIESYDPDVVILLYYLPNAMWDNLYNFQNFIDEE
ncbi:MAG: hypothetical protein K2K21_13685 [Lachnospiraceae bacterium]|nr:hypothetical protein [Lachnospiraceae bacterium]